MKIFKYTILILIIISTAGCSDRLDNLFYDPNKHIPEPDDLLPGMMTQMLKSRFFVQDYGEWYYHFGGGFGVPAYIQIAVRRPHPSEASYFSDWSDLSGAGNFYTDMRLSLRFNYYYTNLKNFGLIRDEMNTLSGDDYNAVEIYYLIATVIKDAVGLHMVDMYNKIPYSEAFLGTQGVFFPVYDDGETIYEAILTELADMATKLPTAYNNMTEYGKSTFASQDIAFKGDVDQWIQYINSVRLRHAVRVSGVNEELAKTHIDAVMNNLPTNDQIWENTQENENTIGNSAGGVYSRALYEQAYNTLVPNVIIQAMNYDDIDYVEGEDDPRLPVIATPTRYADDNWQFVGTSMDYDAQYPYWPLNKTDADFDAGPGITARTFINYPTSVSNWLKSTYCQYNIGTFTFGEIPSYMSSRAENDLLLAEIALKELGSTGKTAAGHIKDAIVHSTEFWYKVNQLSTFWESQVSSDELYRRVFKPTQPDDAVIEYFAEKVKAEFEAAATLEDKMEIIMTQKYIHLNILQVFELWAEIRRTRHPKLEMLQANGVKHSPMVERAKYPSTEQQRNSTNYNKVRSEDNFTTPVFWIPSGKVSESYYRNDYLPLKGFDVLPDPNPNR